MLHLDKSHNERDTVKQFIQSNKQLKNSLLIFDRGYHSPPLALAGGAEYTLENKSYYLKTNLLDCEKYTLPVLTEYYHERWEIEEHFKYMKNTLTLGDISLKSELKIKKTILCGLIFSKIVFALCNIFSNNTACKSGKYVINKKLITHGLVNSNMLARRGKKYEKKCNNPNKKWHEKARKMKYKTNNVETT